MSADSHPIAGVVRFVVGNGPLVVTPVSGGGGTVNHVTSVALDAAAGSRGPGSRCSAALWLLLSDLAGRPRRPPRAPHRLDGLGRRRRRRGARIAAPGPVRRRARAVEDRRLVADRRDAALGLRAVAQRPAGDARGARRRCSVARCSRSRARYEEIAAPLGLALAFTFSATGHAETTNPTWLSLLADTLHLLAMAAWVGGLVLLVVGLLPRRDPDELDAVLPVFSRVAFTAVVVMAVTGTYAAWRGVGSLRALVHTEYGLLVLAKVALFVGLLAVGNLSRRVVQRKLGRGVRDDRRRRGPATSRPARRAVAALGARRGRAGRRGARRDRGAGRAAARGRGAGRAGPRTGHRERRSRRRPHGHRHASTRDSTARSTSRSPSRAAAPRRSRSPAPPACRRSNSARSRSSSSARAPGCTRPAASTCRSSGDWVIDLVVTSSKFDAVTADVTPPSQLKGLSLKRIRVVSPSLSSCSALFVLAGPASAHVSVSRADDATPGAEVAVLTFHVPTESATASTTKLAVAAAEASRRSRCCRCPDGRSRRRSPATTRHRGRLDGVGRRGDQAGGVRRLHPARRAAARRRTR